MKIEIDQSVLLNIPARKAWDILWKDYTNVGNWATIIPESAPRYDGNKLVGRTCSSTYGDVQEIITGHDDEKMTYSYEADGLPKMFKSGKNLWSIQSVDENKARVNMSLRMELSTIPGLLMGWMIKPKMKKDIAGLMEDLKHYAETGNPHPKKNKSMLKWNKHRLKKAV